MQVSAILSRAEQRRSTIQRTFNIAHFATDCAAKYFPVLQQVRVTKSTVDQSGFERIGNSISSLPKIHVHRLAAKQNGPTLFAAPYRHIPVAGKLAATTDQSFRIQASRRVEARDKYCVICGVLNASRGRDRRAGDRGRVGGTRRPVTTNETSNEKEGFFTRFMRKTVASRRLGSKEVASRASTNHRSFAPSEAVKFLLLSSSCASRAMQDR